MVACSERILYQVKDLRQKKLLDIFIFKEKDYVTYMKHEVIEVKQVVCLYAVKDKDQVANGMHSTKA